MLLSLPLLASAYDVEINGVWYSLNPEEQVAQVTFQHLRIGDRCEWFNGYRFASESNSNGDEWFIVPMDLWERMKTETFYVTVTGDNPSIKVQDGWWSNVWTGNSIVPGNEMLTDNGNGTWTLSVNLAGDPLLNTMDEKHLQFTGTGFTLEDIYFLDANAGDNSGKLFVWENGTGTFDLETVNIPEKFNYEGLEYVVNGIGNGAFRDCESLTSVKIPNSVVSIGSYAFYGCI